MNLARSCLVAVRQSIFGLALAALCVSSANATSVNWGVQFFGLPKITSTGAPLDESFVFELGAFANGFTPTATNKADWAANWHPANRGFYDADTMGAFGGIDFVSNAAPFQTTSKAYLWGHNCSTANGEWILVTDPTWTWPQAPSGVGGEGTNWNTMFATEFIVGELRGSGFHLKTAPSSGNAIPQIPATEWRTMRFSTTDLNAPLISGWQADPDGDGMTNLMEYALGKNPNSKLSVWTSTPSILTIGNSSYLNLAVPKCGYSSAALAIEVSSDLGAWYSVAPHVVQIANSADLLHVRSATAISASAKQYIRLKASIP